MKKMFSIAAFFGALIATTAAIVDIDACTGIKLTAKDGSSVEGRTLEFGIPVHITTVVVPRNYDFQGTTPKGAGLAYKSKYAAVGCMAFTDVAILDGLNEKGLGVGTFYFPTFAKYSPTTSENQAQSLSPVEFPNWLLTQFATVEEVKAALSSVVIAPTVVKAWGNQPAPFHYIVFDKSGKGLVIEPIDGKLVVHDNPLGTFTNSPEFTWHMTNLRNFINLSAYNVDSLTLHGVQLDAFGQGSGMVGMPGDFTPPSRFVRAAIYSTAATPSKNADEAVLQAFHLLNNFDIPIGVAREKTGDSYASDFTQFTCVRDPQSLKYYFKSYDNQAISAIDLSKFDLDAKAVKKWEVTGTQSIVDVTDKLK